MNRWRQYQLRERAQEQLADAERKMREKRNVVRRIDAAILRGDTAELEALLLFVQSGKAGAPPSPAAAMSDTCHDCGRDADPEYTMRFDDIGAPPIHWCSACGMVAQEMNAALEKAFAERPGFAGQLALEIERAKSGGNQ